MLRPAKHANRRRQRRGFTLTETLVTLTVTSILGALGAHHYINADDTSEAVAVKTATSQVMTFLAAADANNDTPPSISDLRTLLPADFTLTGSETTWSVTGLGWCSNITRGTHAWTLTEPVPGTNC